MAHGFGMGLKEDGVRLRQDGHHGAAEEKGEKNAVVPSTASLNTSFRAAPISANKASIAASRPVSVSHPIPIAASSHQQPRKYDGEQADG